MSRKVEMVEVRGILEGTPRYMITLDGEKWGDLYFNMTGYVAEHGIPVPSSTRPDGVSSLDIGERPLSRFKSEIYRANREWTMKSASSKTADSSKPWKVVETVKNAYGHVLRHEVVAEFSDERRAQTESRKLEQEQKAQSDGSLSSRLGRSEFHVNYDRTASSKTAALMMTGQYKALVAKARMVGEAYRAFDRNLSLLVDGINSPIGTEDRHSVTRMTSGVGYEMDRLESFLTGVRSTIIEIDEMVGRMGASDSSTASELLSVARELVALNFPTQDAYDKYMKEHPDADKSRHRVVEMKDDKFPGTEDDDKNPEGAKHVKNTLSGFKKQVSEMAEDLKKLKTMKGIKDSVKEKIDDLHSMIISIGDDITNAVGSF